MVVFKLYLFRANYTGRFCMKKPTLARIHTQMIPYRHEAQTRPPPAPLPPAHPIAASPPHPPYPPLPCPVRSPEASGPIISPDIVSSITLSTITGRIELMTPFASAPAPAAGRGDPLTPLCAPPTVVKLYLSSTRRHLCGDLSARATPPK